MGPWIRVNDGTSRAVLDPLGRRRSCAAPPSRGRRACHIAAGRALRSATQYRSPMFPMPARPPVGPVSPEATFLSVKLLVRFTALSSPGVGSSAKRIASPGDGHESVFTSLETRIRRGGSGAYRSSGRRERADPRRVRGGSGRRSSRARGAVPLRRSGGSRRCRVPPVSLASRNSADRHAIRSLRAAARRPSSRPERPSAGRRPR